MSTLPPEPRTVKRVRDENDGPAAFTSADFERPNVARYVYERRVTSGSPAYIARHIVIRHLVGDEPATRAITDDELVQGFRDLLGTLS